MNYPTLSDGGVVTHVLVPIDDFNRISRAAAKPPSDADVQAAISLLNDPDAAWVDGEDTVRDIISDGIDAARRHSGLTQTELADAVGLSQPQISRLERNPDSASLGLLKRIAAVLHSRD